MEQSAWEARAVHEHGVQAFRVAAILRMVAVWVFVPLVTLAAMRGEPGWAEHLPILVPYAGLISAAFAARARPWIQRVAPYGFALDALVVFALQRQTMPNSPFPAGVAGFTLGLFVLLVMLAGVSMRWRATLATAALTMPLQVMLMAQAGVGMGARVAAIVVLAASALTQSVFVQRFKSMVRAAASSEAAWRVETERAVRLEETNHTIAQLYGKSVEQTGRLERLQTEKEVLTSLLVHDLRAPLGAVKSNLAFLKDEVRALNDQDVTESVAESLLVTERLSAMIGDLLNITKLESGEFRVEQEEVLARSVFESLGRQLAAQARSKQLVVSVRAEDFSFEGDQALLMRTLENLASNALRYTPKGGRVHLAARREAEQIVLSVHNDGAVIPLAARATLFDKFVQAGEPQANRRAGWGLGLYFCKLCVQAHEGVIEIEDVEGWATSFVIRLPARAALRAAA